MKNYANWVVVAVAIAGCASVAQVTPEDHAAHHPPVAGESGKPDAAPAAPPVASEMQASMKTMQQQMEKIRASRNPAERQALLKQHMEAMQRHMELMKSMMGAPATAAGAAGKGGMQGAAMGCNSMMGGMDMMHSMMRQMQQHIEAEKDRPEK